MTSKTLVSLAISLATLVPVTVSAGVGTSIIALSVPETATVGVATPISCAATDPDGMSRIAIKATDPDGTSTVLGAAFGVNELSVEWLPAADGAFTIRCHANGLSGPDALANASQGVTVSRSTVVPASQPLDSSIPDPTSPMW